MPFFTTRQRVPALLARQTLFPREASTYHDQQKKPAEDQPVTRLDFVQDADKG